MNNTGKKENLWMRIKIFFKNLFTKEKTKELPERKEKQQFEMSINKEEYLRKYKDIKDKKLDIYTLTEDELKVFIQLAKQEIQFLDKRINEEITQRNIYKRKIEYYNNMYSEKIS